MQTTLVYVLTVAASLFLAGKELSLTSLFYDALCSISVIIIAFFFKGNCQLECFDGSVSECNGGVISGVSTAEDCCLGDGYWFKPDGSEVCKQCIGKGI